jgi:hypothetical protein
MTMPGGRMARGFGVLMAFLWVWMPGMLFSDALVVSKAMKADSIAEIFVERDAVRVELEIGLDDIEAFKNLLADGLYESLTGTSVPLALRVERFFRDDFVVEADGAVVPGEVVWMEPRKRLLRDDITGEPLPSQEGAEEIIFAEFVFPLAGKPEALSFIPPMNEYGVVARSIGMMVYHMGLPVMDFRYLSRRETLDLDWDDPWYSRFKNKNLWRQYNEPISAFLYAEPYETRVEVIVRPKDIQQWHDLGIADLEVLPVEMQPQLKEQIAQFLPTRMELSVDGAVVEPKLQRINFLRRTLKSSTVIDPPEELDAISATLGIIYSVPTETLPKESQLTWNLFSPKMQVVRAAATDEAGPLPWKIRPDDNVLVWRNYLKNPTIPSIKAIAPPSSKRLLRIPVGTLLCAIILIPLVRTLHREKGRRAALAGGTVLFGCAVLIYPFLSVGMPFPSSPRLSDEAASEVVAGLLANVYTSFDFRGESAIYDALEQSLDGDLLTEVYLQTKSSLELQSQGGAQVRVKSVELEEARFRPQKGRDGFRAQCVWKVMGSVGHWGHIHRRTNRYEAELDIMPIDGQWKIAALEILEEKRVN